MLLAPSELLALLLEPLGLFLLLADDLALGGQALLLLVRKDRILLSRVLLFVVLVVLVLELVRRRDHLEEARELVGALGRNGLDIA